MAISYDQDRYLRDLYNQHAAMQGLYGQQNMPVRMGRLGVITGSPAVPTIRREPEPNKVLLLLNK